MNDVEKYARNSTMVQVIRHVIKSMSVEAGTRIKFQHFGQSNYGSREMGDAGLNNSALPNIFLFRASRPGLSQNSAWRENGIPFHLETAVVRKKVPAF